MADLYRECGALAVNGSPLFFLLRFAHEPWPHPRIEGLTLAGLERTRGRIAELRAGLAASSPDAELVAAEAAWILEALDFACELGLARLALAEGAPLSSVELAKRRQLAEHFDGVREGLRSLWPRRSRPGGARRIPRPLRPPGRPARLTRDPSAVAARPEA